MGNLEEAKPGKGLIPKFMLIWLMKAIFHMKSGKAAVSSGIVAEKLKALDVGE